MSLFQGNTAPPPPKKKGGSLFYVDEILVDYCHLLLLNLTNSLQPVSETCVQN
jgi:hypothetical protein